MQFPTKGRDRITAESEKGRQNPFADHLPIKSAHLVVGMEFPCELFIPVSDEEEGLRLQRLVEKDRIYERNVQSYLESEGIFEVFISREDEESYLQYLDYLVRRSLHIETFSKVQKIHLLYDNALAVLRKIDREEPNKSNLKLAMKFVESFLLHLYFEEFSAEALLSTFHKGYGLLTHCVQTALLGMSFCKFLGWERNRVRDFGMGALLHDMGKRVIQRHILSKGAGTKTGKISLLKAHPTVARDRLIKTTILTEDQLTIVTSHHEAFDGSGFPEGLKGSRIHEYARVARVVNLFDSLSTRKTFSRPSLTASATIQIMYDEMGGTFDPQLLDAFSAFMGYHKKTVESREGLFRARTGDELILNPSNHDYRCTSPLVGIVPGEFLIVRTPKGQEWQKYFFEREWVVVRYVTDGMIFGFRSTVLAHHVTPCRLLVLSYPASVESLDLRQHTRVECFVPAAVGIGGELYPGAILDLSQGGCRFGLQTFMGREVPLLAEGEDVAVHTRLIGEETAVSLTGKLRKVSVQNGKYELGIKFEGLRPTTGAILSDFIDRMLALAGAKK